MSLEIKIPKTLNEAIIGKCNMDVPEHKVDVEAQVPITYADALNVHQDRVEKIEQDFKEQDKNIEEFVKDNSKREIDIPDTEDMKKMKLSESLFEDYTECAEVEEAYTPADKLYKQADEIADYIEEFVTELDMADDMKQFISNDKLEIITSAAEVLHNFAVEYSHVMDNETVFESVEDEDRIRKEYKALKDEAAKYGDNVPEELAKKLHAKAMEFADAKIGTVRQEIAAKNDDDLDESGALAAAGMAALTSAASGFGSRVADKIFGEATAVAERPRTRGENEKPEDKLINQVEDDKELLWMKVYDELSATVDNEGEGKDVDKELKARRGERYEEVYPGPGDNTIIVYGTKPEDFEFAKKVADHYGVKADAPKEDRNVGSNSYYKYSMIIRI